MIETLNLTGNNYIDPKFFKSLDKLKSNKKWRERYLDGKWKKEDKMEATKCKSCGADIFFHLTKNGKQMPINCKPTMAYSEKHGIIKVYLTHFATCPDAEKFSKGGK